MKAVLIAVRTFGKYTTKPLEYLKENGMTPEIVDVNQLNIIKEKIKEVDALIIGAKPDLTADMIESSNLKIIARHGVGLDNVDIKAATARKIPVTITKGANTESVSEMTVALLLALSRNLVHYHTDLVRNHQWPDGVGSEILGKTLGLLGFGEIARKVASKALCLGMKVIATDPFVSNKQMMNLGVKGVEMDVLLEKSDFLSIHVPLNEKTRNLIGESELKKMKPSSYLINTSRGSIVDETALTRALKERWIAGAAVDVFQKEPPNFNSELFKCENLIATPHIAAHTFEAISNMNMMAAKAVVDFFNGHIPHCVVNRELFPILWPDREIPM